MRTVKTILLAGAVALTGSAAAVAQESGDAAAGFALQLNSAKQDERGCELAVVVRNGSEKTLERGVWNLAFFDAGGKFSRILGMELKDIRAQSAYAKVFTLRDTECSSISWILINDAPVCQVAGGAEGDALCLGEMTAESAVDTIRFGTN